MREHPSLFVLVQLACAAAGFGADSQPAPQIGVGVDEARLTSLALGERKIPLPANGTADDAEIARHVSLAKPEAGIITSELEPKKAHVIQLSKRVTR